MSEDIDSRRIPDARQTVRNGVCLLCGAGVLASGEHIRDDLPPCFGSLRADAEADVAE